MHKYKIGIKVCKEVFVKYAAINPQGHSALGRLEVAVEGYNKRTLPIAKSCLKHLLLACFFVLRLYILKQ